MRAVWVLAAAALVSTSAFGASLAARQASAPLVPTGFSVVAANNGEIVMSWDDPSDSTITGYEYDLQAQIATLTASDAAVDDSLGWSVAINGDTMVVGAPYDDAGSAYAQQGHGSAYVFTRQSGVWSQIAKLTASDGYRNDFFGLSVAIDGDTVVVGAPYDDDGGSNSGSAYVFTEPAGGWVSASGNIKLTASDAATYDYFGRSVAIDGDTVVVGAHRDDDAAPGAGSAYVFTEPAGGWVSASGNIKLTAAAGGGWFGWSVAIDGDTVVVGAPYDDDGGWHSWNSGSAYVFTEPAGGWVSASGNIKLTAMDAAAEDWFGWSVAVAGDTVVVGAPYDDDGGSDSGSAYVFTEPAGGWVSGSETVKLTAMDAAANDYFGWSVAIDGDTVVVGAPGNSWTSGPVHVFFEPAGGWASGGETLELTASDGAANDQFGWSVAIDGDTVVAGAPDDDGSSYDEGSAYVYRVSAWAAVDDSAPGGANATSFTLTRAPDGAQFGLRVRAVNSVGVSDATATATATASLVAPSQPTGLSAAAGSGEAALSWDDASDSSINAYEYYVRAQLAKLADSNGVAGDAFGRSVAVDGDTMVVGAPEDDDNGVDSGSVHVFVRQSGVWSQVATLTATDGDDGDVFGYSVAVAGDTVVVGAYGDDDAGSASGSVYVFSEPAGGWASASGSIKLTASDGAASDWFGRSVAVDGDTVVVGAYGDDDAVSGSGSVYVFTEPAGGWASASGSIKLTASDRAANDWFGWSVAVDGDTVVVGAPYDDHYASTNRGSAYVFTEPAGGWVSASGNIKLTASDWAALDEFGYSVAVDGDTVVVGAYGDDDAGSESGSAYVFTKPASGWAAHSGNIKLTASDGAASDEFGWSVAVDGDTVVVGAPYDDDAGSESGSVYVFSEPAYGWASGSEAFKLTAADGAASDEFGYSVAVDGDTVVVGAYGDDDAGSESGSVYVYRASVWAAVGDSAPGGANATSYTVTGLVTGAEYGFSVRAVNDRGPSDPSAVATAIPLVPDQPTGLTAAAGDTQVALSWDDPVDISITGYEYELHEQGQSAQAWATIADSAPGGANATSYTVAGLTNGAQYDFRVRAVNAIGSSNPSAAATVALVVPDQPTGLAAAAGNAGVALSWDDPVDISITGYEYELHEQGQSAQAWATIADSAPGGANATSYTVAGLTNAAQYDFRVRAVNAIGSSDPSAAATVALVVPDQPTGLAAAAGDAGVALSWDDPVDVTVTGYEYVLQAQITELSATGAAQGDKLGFSVAVDGDTMVVGAKDDNGGSGSGSAYVYARQSGAWSQVAKLTASDADGNDEFGWSVAVDGDTVVVGARWGDDDDVQFSGSAYVYTKPVGGWANTNETAKLTLSDAAASDLFGFSVAVDGDTVVVGARGDDDDGTNSGSAYVYTKPVGGWANTDETAKLTATDGAGQDSFGHSVAVDGDTVVVGAFGDDDGATDSGSVYVFTEPVGGWATTSGNIKLTALDPGGWDLLGYSVAVDGDTIVAGAHGDDDGATNSGSVYVFTEPVGGWATASGNIKLTASDATANHFFGYWVAVDGDTVAVGAPDAVVLGAVADGQDGGTASGSAYVFFEPTNGWASSTETAKLAASDAAIDDFFGFSVDVDGDTVAVGAPGTDDDGTDSGSAYIYQTSPWATIADSAPGGANATSYTVAGLTNAAQYDFRVRAVNAIGSSDPSAAATVALVVPDQPTGLAAAAGDAGVALSWDDPVDVTVTGYEYVLQAQITELSATGAAQGDKLGFSVAVDGDTMVVGAKDDNGGSGSGSAYVYARQSGAWSQVAKLTASDADGNDEFGWSVAVDGDTVVVGARWGDDDDVQFSGSAYVYTKPVGGWANTNETAKLTLSDAAASDLFGFSVAVDGDTVVVGARGDDDDGTNSGSAYVYTKPVGGWANTDETAKLTATDGAGQDSFGHSVAVDGDTVVVGAFGDDDGATDSGSVYVFTEPVGGWATTSGNIKLTALDPGGWDLLGYSVAVDGDTIVAGAHGDDDGATNSGSVYVFTEPVGGWATASGNIKLTASDATANHFFGYWVAVDGDTVAVGAPDAVVLGAVADGQDGGTASGSAYVFFEPTNGWASSTETAKLAASDAAIDDFFGFSVDVDGDTVAVGAPGTDDDGTDSGSAYIYQTSPWATIADSAPGGANATSYTVAGLTNAAPYDFRVRAVNAIGSSDPSAAATATPTAP